MKEKTGKLRKATQGKREFILPIAAPSCPHTFAGVGDAGRKRLCGAVLERAGGGGKTSRVEDGRVRAQGSHPLPFLPKALAALKDGGLRPVALMPEVPELPAALHCGFSPKLLLP